jgi:hypothetical protein
VPWRAFVAAAFLSVVLPFPAVALPPQLEAVAEKSPLSSFVIQPVRVVWQSEAGVENAGNLLKPKRGQALLKEIDPPLVLAPGAGLVLDFGIQISGNIELFTTMTKEKEVPSVRIRLGESVAETMAELGERGAQNDHALRDQTVQLPWLGKTTIGPSGFRFLRIDNADKAIPLELSEVRAILQLRDIPYLGSFRCSDDRLNRIWQTGAYTVHLNMQDYLWDGIKRDRLVWLGDMHPEVSVINVVADNTLKTDGPKDLSTFYGFYVLNALAKSGDIDTALDFISRYWGAMLDFGATTFWEDFDLEWTKNAGRIDELVPEGKDDLHGDFGAHCYIGFRHSFCHGWAGGPTAWLSRNVLGIEPAAPGFAKLRVTPRLGGLEWAEGSYPTPKGIIRVRHEKQADGTVKSTINLPPGVEQVPSI